MYVYMLGVLCVIYILSYFRDEKGNGDVEKRKGEDVDGDDECLGAMSSLYAASDVAACECYVDEMSVV